MKPRQIRLTIDSLNEKGFGVGRYEGQKVECLGALPAEDVLANVYKKKRGALIADVIEIITPSVDRVTPRDQAYSSTSPYQILSNEAEIKRKLEFISGLFAKWQTSSTLPLFETLVCDEQNQWNYRNKVEFSFFVDGDNHVNLAFHKRGSSKGKIPVEGTSIVNENINIDARTIVAILNKLALSAFDFKTIILRYSHYTKSTIAVLYCKIKPEEDTNTVYKRLANEFRENYIGNIHVVFSKPLSPASVITQRVYSQGEWDVIESVSGQLFRYPADSFFQINIGMFDKILADIRHFVKTEIPLSTSKTLLDLYAGVGTLGIHLGDLFWHVEGVELFAESDIYARNNALQNEICDYNFTVASSSDVVASFENKDCIIIDPPRSGMEQKVILGLLDSRPEYLIYVSCNPVTQARDLENFYEKYIIVLSKAYNLYPKTPHLESLIVLKLKKNHEIQKSSLV